MTEGGTSDGGMDRLGGVEAVVTFTGTGEHYRTELTRKEAVRGWIEIPCPECDHFDGVGMFVQPDGSKHDCIHCSTSGWVMASLPPMAVLRQRVNQMDEGGKSDTGTSHPEEES